jgi:tRNA-2-methylthio-N6-dimethylallyladenosine synthase
VKIHTIALGCQMSAADADEMAAPFAARGFSRSSKLQDADAVVVSTCTVRQHAEDKALSLIGRLAEWKAEDPERVLIVAGCAAERLGGWLQKRFPFVDLVVGAKSIERFPEIVEGVLAKRFQAPAGPAESAPVSSYVTIMRGCNYSCSYCIVPAVRGRELYRPVDAVLADVRAKVEGGAREIMLLGQTVNSYEHSGVSFADLLRLVDRVPGVERIRFMSPHPYYVDDAMIAAMAETRSVCPSLHLPVQSGSDRLLKLMRRNYTRDSFLLKVEALRRAIPHIALSTDVIVGFPTEREEDFQATLSLLEHMRASSAYCFKYSPRASTEAASWSDDVLPQVKEERLARLNDLVDRLNGDALQEQLGRAVEVLAEEPGFGRSREGFKVKLNEPAAPGSILSAVVTGRTRLTLQGEAAVLGGSR